MDASAHAPDPEPLRLTTRMAGTTRVVAAAGEIDLATAGELATALAARAEGETELVLDLSTTSFLDSSGIRVLVEAHRDAERDGIPFAVVPGGDSIRALLETTGVATHLDLRETAPE